MRKNLHLFTYLSPIHRNIYRATLLLIYAPADANERVYLWVSTARTAMPITHRVTPWLLTVLAFILSLLSLRIHIHNAFVTLPYLPRRSCSLLMYFAPVAAQVCSHAGRSFPPSAKLQDIGRKGFGRSLSRANHSNILISYAAFTVRHARAFREKKRNDRVANRANIARTAAKIE